jgi:hypothetical protein
METPVTWTQLIIASVFILVTSLAPQLYQIYSRYRDSQDKEKQQRLEEKKQEVELKRQEMEKDDKAVQHWEKIAGEYARQIESLRRLEVENAELRPLVLKNALLQQKVSQSEEDKEDWKAHANRLTAQLEEANVIPLPFRRIAHNGDTQERLKTISQKMRAIKDESEKSKTAPADSPTLTFPPGEIPGSGEGLK